MIPIYTFGASLVAIIALIYFRYTEEKNGVLYLATFRRLLDKAVVHFFSKIKKVQRIFGSRGWEHLLHDSSVFLLHQFSLSALFLVRFLEKRLVRLVNFVRGKHVAQAGDASDFLKQVSQDRTHLRE
jgi:hypothetical protein